MKISGFTFIRDGDEIVHEQDIDRIRNALLHYLDKPKIETLAFDYHHFCGDFRHVPISSHAYRKAVRVFRNT